MPLYDCGDDECDECQRAFGPDRSRAIANFKRREAAYAQAIPSGVYWSREAGNFYDERTNRGMGIDFYNRWQARKDAFPEKATSSAGIDLYFDRTVTVAS